MQILLSRTQAGPGRKGKQEQEQTSRNHVQVFILTKKGFETTGKYKGSLRELDLFQCSNWGQWGGVKKPNNC